MARILPKPIAFNWDKGNIDKNLIKHNITNKEIEEAFTNKPLILFKDIRHSQKEERFLAYGKTNENNKLHIVFTIRNNKIRIISARIQSKKERRFYEKKD